MVHFAAVSAKLPAAFATMISRAKANATTAAATATTTAN